MTYISNRDRQASKSARVISRIAFIWASVSSSASSPTLRARPLPLARSAAWRCCSATTHSHIASAHARVSPTRVARCMCSDRRSMSSALPCDEGTLICVRICGLGSIRDLVSGCERSGETETANARKDFTLRDGEVAEMVSDDAVLCMDSV